MKKSLLVLFGTGLLLLVLSSNGLAQSYELSFSANGFTGRSESEDYFNNYGTIHKNTTVGWLICQVNFPASAEGMNVSRLSVSFVDNTNTGQLQVQLIKVDRWTGSAFTVADVSSGVSQASASIRFMNQPKSQMSATGITNNRWAWAIWANFGDSGSKLGLHSVTIRYE